MTDHPFINATLFACLGVVVFAVAFHILARLAPVQLWKEVLEKQNVALAILAGAVSIGISLIIAAAMH